MRSKRNSCKCNGTAKNTGNETEECVYHEANPERRGQRNVLDDSHTAPPGELSIRFFLFQGRKPETKGYGSGDHDSWIRPLVISFAAISVVNRRSGKFALFIRLSASEACAMAIYRHLSARTSLHGGIIPARTQGLGWQTGTPRSSFEMAHPHFITCCNRRRARWSLIFTVVNFSPRRLAISAAVREWASCSTITAR